MSRITNEELTGRRRHVGRLVKTSWFAPARPVLVLQVERRYLRTCLIGDMVECEWLTNWRDARVGDVTVVE